MQRRGYGTEINKAKLISLIPDLTEITISKQLQSLIERGRVSIQKSNRFGGSSIFKLHPESELILDPHDPVDWWTAEKVHKDIQDVLGFLRFTARKLLEGDTKIGGIEETRQELGQKIKDLEKRIIIMKSLYKNPDLWNIDTLPIRLFSYIECADETQKETTS